MSKGGIDFDVYYRDLNMNFVFDNKFYGSNKDYVKDYNELLKKFPNASNSQINALMIDFFQNKNNNNKVIVDLRTFESLSKKDRVDVIIVNRSSVIDFYVGFYWHKNCANNILKYGKSLRIVKIPTVYSNMLKKDYPGFSLTCFYVYNFATETAGDQWSKNNLFAPKTPDQLEFNEGKLDLKSYFPVKLADILDSTKNITNKSEKMNVT